MLSSSSPTRQKWLSETVNLSVGDVVLMVDPSNDVHLGLWLYRVSEVLPGTDGRVRTVRVQVGDRIYTQPVARLIRLPAETDGSSEAATLPEPDVT